MTEAEEDEQWRHRFREKLGIPGVEIRLEALEIRLNLLEAKSGLRTRCPDIAEQLANALKPRRKDWWDWLERQPTWIQALGFVVVPLVFMTLGALWFLLMYALAKWL